MPFPNSYVPSVSFKNAAGAGFPPEFIAFEEAEYGGARIYLLFTNEVGEEMPERLRGSARERGLAAVPKHFGPNCV
jgi:hypothetical protein